MKKNSRGKSLGVKSIRYEILFILLPIVVVSMILLSFLGYRTAKQIIWNKTNQEMKLNLDASVAKIEKSLSQNRMVAQSLAKAAQTNKNVMEPDNYKKMLPSVVSTNDETFGAGIWFEPYQYDAKEKYFSPYCMRENGTITYVDNYSLGEGVYYTDQDWYTGAVNTDKGTVWSPPYYDDFAKISMVTASSPFFDDSGKFIGVATADIDLTGMQKMIVDLQVNKGDRVFLLDTSGIYIADADSSKLLKVNIAQDPNPSLAKLGVTLLDDKEGSGTFEQDGEKYLVWYTQVPESGWILASARTETQLFGSVYALGKTLFVLSAVMILLVIGVLIFFMQQKIVTPLKNLADVTERIAEGDLSVEIHHNSGNEIGTVFQSIEKTTKRLHDYIAYIDELSGVLGQIAGGNLDYQLNLHYVGEFEKLKLSLEHIREALTQTLQTIQFTADEVNSGAAQMSDGAQALAASTTEQAATVEELSASVLNVSHQSEQNTVNVRKAAEYEKQVTENLRESSEYMHQVYATMSEIGQSSQEISKITKLVEDIAFQTNILALNAAVEAARAGSAGKGFAIVADEVRNLAGKSAAAAKQTAELIAKSTTTVSEGEKLTDKTMELVNTVLENSHLLGKIMVEIEQSSLIQAEAIDQINMGISQVTAVVQTNAATAEENSASSEELAAQAQTLKEEAGKFRFMKK